MLIQFERQGFIRHTLARILECRLFRRIITFFIVQHVKIKNVAEMNNENLIVTLLYSLTLLTELKVLNVLLRYYFFVKALSGLHTKQTVSPLRLGIIGMFKLILPQC